MKGSQFRIYPECAERLRVGVESLDLGFVVQDSRLNLDMLDVVEGEIEPLQVDEMVYILDLFDDIVVEL